MHRTNNRGFPVLDRNLQGVGRLKKTFGTDDPDTVAGIKLMVTTLYKNGDWSLLEAVRDNKLTLLEVYAKWKNQKLSKVNVNAALDFKTTAERWLASYTDIKPKTRTNYQDNINQLLKVKASFTVDDIPAVLKEYRKRCVKAGTHRQFNTARNTMRSFLKNYFDQFHPVYQAVVSVKPLEERRKHEERSWSVQEVESTMKRMRPELAAMFWTMCVTGAGLDEYENGLTVEDTHGVRVRGTKMTRVDDRRNRVVPKVVDPAPLKLRVKQFRKHLKAANPEMQVYDARRCFARWCLEAGVPFDRVQQYMGHAPKSMTERYARSTVQQHLKEDAERLTKYLDTQRKVKVNTAASRFFELE